MKREKFDGINAYEVHIELYDKYFYVAFGREEHDKLQGLSRDYDSFQACTYLMEDGTKFLFFKKPSNEYFLNGIVAHEVLHWMFEIMKSNGLKFTHDNQEATTYLLEYAINKTQQVFEAERRRLRAAKKKT